MENNNIIVAGYSISPRFFYNSDLYKNFCKGHHHTDGYCKIESFRQECRKRFDTEFSKQVSERKNKKSVV